MSQRSNRPLRRQPQVKKNRNKSLKIPLNLPAYTGQVVKQFKLPGVPLVLSTTMTTGVVAATYQISTDAIQNYSSRFQPLFEEYRIVKVKFKFATFSNANPGLMTHWIDEKQAGAPSSVEAKQKSTSQFSLSSPGSTLVWIARDPLDLQYTDVSVSTTVCTYKIYTDTASFGASPIPTPVGQLTTEIWIQFRGLN